MVAKWRAREDDRGFWIEAASLTRLGVQRELKKMGFVRIFPNLNGLASYIRYWPGGVYTIARIHLGIHGRRVKVIVSYYNEKGRKYRKLPKVLQTNSTGDAEI